MHHIPDRSSDRYSAFLPFSPFWTLATPQHRDVITLALRTAYMCRDRVAGHSDWIPVVTTHEIQQCSTPALLPDRAIVVNITARVRETKSGVGRRARAREIRGAVAIFFRFFFGSLFVNDFCGLSRLRQPRPAATPPANRQRAFSVPHARRSLKCCACKRTDTSCRPSVSDNY